MKPTVSSIKIRPVVHSAEIPCKMRLRRRSRRALRVLSLAALTIVMACGSGTVAIPRPRPIITTSGARIRADHEEMKVVNEWVTREQENISEDPAVLDSYVYPLTQTAIHMGPFFDITTPRGEAVLLPGSTGEVQAIVRICNKYRIKLKASSTFWSAQGFPSDENTIQLDMRRMDRILEIDEKNLFAVRFLCRHDCMGPVSPHDMLWRRYQTYRRRRLSKHYQR